MGDRENKKSLYLKIMANYLLAIGIVCGIIFLVPRFVAFFWPFIVGWIIAMIANPLVRFLERKLKLVRKHGTAIVIVFVLAIVISLLYLLVYVLIKQGASFAANFEDLYANASGTIQGTINDLKNKYSILPSGMVDMIIHKGGVLINHFINDISGNGFTFSDASMVVKSVAEGLLMTIITILLSYFLTAERDNILKIYVRNVSSGFKSAYEMIVGNVVAALGGYFKAQFKIMCCVFVVQAIGLLILGVDYAILFALIIAFVDFLPVFGAGAIIWPWCVYELLCGRYFMAIFLFAIYLICQLIRQVLQPKMVADCVGLSPLSTLFYMFVGYRISGVIGMIIGIPVGMIITTFYKNGLFDRLIRGAKIIVTDFNEWRKF